MTRFYIFLMAVALLATDVFAARETIDGYTWTYAVDTNKESVLSAWVTAISPYPQGCIEIPSRLGDLPVRRISYGAFKHCDGLTSVIIPNGIKFIGAGAFSGCNSLSMVEIPEDIWISPGSFLGCNFLRRIVVRSDPARIKRLFSNKKIFPPQATIVSVSDEEDKKRLIEAAEKGDAEAIAKFREGAAKSFMGFEFGSDIMYIKSHFGASRTSDGHALRVTSGVNWPRFREFTVGSLSDGCIYGSLKSGKMYRLERGSESFPDSATKEEKRAEFQRTVNVIAKKYMVSPVRSKKQGFLGLWNDEIAKFVVGQMEITLEWVNEDSMKLTAIHKGYEALAEKEWREDMENQDGADVL